MLITQEGIALQRTKTWYPNKIIVMIECCHVRMLSPNKTCSKDNLDRVIDMQQYNPLIHQQLKRVKDSSCDTCICYH